MRINAALVLYFLWVSILVFLEEIHGSVRHAAKSVVALRSRFPAAASEAAKTGWCSGKAKWQKCLDGVVTAGVLLHRAAEHQVQASARSDSRSCYNCLANNNYLQMSADEGLTNGEAGGLCWLRWDYLGELTSHPGLPKITETFPLLLRRLLQRSGHPCPSLMSSCQLLPWAGSLQSSLSHSPPVSLPEKPSFNPWQLTGSTGRRTSRMKVKLVIP